MESGQARIRRNPPHKLEGILVAKLVDGVQQHHLQQISVTMAQKAKLVASVEKLGVGQTG